MSNYAQNRAMQEIDELFGVSSDIKKDWDKNSMDYTPHESGVSRSYGSYSNYIPVQLIISPLISIILIISFFSLMYGINELAKITVLTAIYFAIQIGFIIHGIKESIYCKPLDIIGSIFIAILMNPIFLGMLWMILAFFISPC